MFAWTVILGVVIVLTVAVLIPRLSGATPYTVLTGSMRPNYPPGTLVVVKPIASSDVRVGDVVTYQLESGKAPVVTHRVVDINRTMGGKTTFNTQGDANDVADDNPVRPVQIRGKLWYSLPLVGYASNVMTGSQRQMAVYVVAVGLIGYAASMFVGALRERRSSRRTD